VRTMISFSIPIDEGNEAIRSGSMGSILQGYLDQVKPEAAYFTTDDNGRRSGFFVVDMKEPADMVRLAEPLFLNLNAQVTFRPVMTPADVMAGAGSMQAARARN